MGKDRLSPYSYFTDDKGITYCCEGHGQLPDQPGLIQASIVYVPAEQDSANRVRVTDSTAHTKQVFDGTEGEEERASPELAETLSRLYKLDVLTGQRIIAISATEIESIFTPTESLYLLLSDKIPGIPVEITRRVQRVIGYLMSKGIDFKDLGLYGGLQSFMMHLRQKTDLKDIDVTVTGVEYTPIVRELALANQRYKTGPTVNTRTNTVDEAVRLRRHQMTRIHLPDDPEGVFCDVKILRKPDDPNSFSPNVRATDENTAVRGVVVYDRETMSSPMSFRIQSPHGEEMTVSSTRYNYTAGVQKGDAVRVTGRKTTEPDHVLLTDSRQHGIYYEDTDIPRVRD